MSRPVPTFGATDFTTVPGWELVAAGLADLAAGRETVNGLLVKSAAERLSALGIEVPGSPMPDAQLRMYELLEAEVGEGRAHGRYNALRRRLLSFLGSARYAPRS